MYIHIDVYQWILEVSIKLYSIVLAGEIALSFNMSRMKYPIEFITIWIEYFTL